MKYVDLEKGIILNEIERGNFNEYPYGSKLVESKTDGFRIEPLNLTPIDDQLAVPIAILNLKGYKTDQCCAGHLDEGVAWSYVRFVEPIFKDQQFCCPKGKNIKDNVLMSIDDDFKTIRVAECNNNTVRLPKIQKMIDDFCQTILKWALDLPYKPKEIRVEDIGVIATDDIPRMGTFIDENTMLLGDKE